MTKWRTSTEAGQGCGGDIDRKSSREYPQLKQHAKCGGVSRSGTFINIMLFDRELDVILSNNKKMFC